MRLEEIAMGLAAKLIGTGMVSKENRNLVEAIGLEYLTFVLDYNDSNRKLLRSHALSKMLSTVCVALNRKHFLRDTTKDDLLEILGRYDAKIHQIISCDTGIDFDDGKSLPDLYFVVIDADSASRLYMDRQTQHVPLDKGGPPRLPEVAYVREDFSKLRWNPAEKPI